MGEGGKRRRGERKEKEKWRKGEFGDFSRIY